MKKILLLLFLILIINVTAQELPNYYDKYLNDFPKLFNYNETQELKNILIETEKATSAEVVIAIVNTTSPSTPQEYRTKLFNFWQIGKKEKDNGLLILYSLQENRIEVETGYGLEGILPDSKLGRLLDEYYVPYRDKNQVSQGIILFTQEVAKIINENKEEVLIGQKTGYNFIIPIIFILIFIILIFLSKKKIKCEKDGLPMKYAGKVAGGGIIAGYLIYKCPKGHIHKIESSSRPGIIGGFGGFGGGGFSGGFGGGASGGGGVGR